MTRWGTKMRRVRVPGCPIALRPADAAVYYATMGYPPRSIERLMRGAITAHSASQAISQARARGEAIPAFNSGPDVPGRLAKVSTRSVAPGEGAVEGGARRG